MAYKIIGTFYKDSGRNEWNGEAFAEEGDTYDSFAAAAAEAGRLNALCGQKGFEGVIKAEVCESFCDEESNA